MMINILIAVLMALLGFSLSMFILSRKGNEKKNIQNRMAYFAGVDISLRHTRQGSQAKQKRLVPVSEKLRIWLKKIAERLDKLQKSNSLDMKMQQAGLPLLGSEFQVIMLGAGAVTGAVLGLLTLSVANGAIGFIAGIVFCMVLLSIKIQRRQAAFMNQLGDMLVMVANALRAGFSFMQAMEHVACEMDDPVKSEVNKVVIDVNVGVSLEEALDSMVRRVNSPDFSLVVSAVLIQRQVGGNLAQILDIISETINERVRMRREVNALTAQGKMSGVILGCLPIGLAAVLQVIAPGYLAPLFADSVGRMAIAGAVVMMLMGFVVIRKIVNIEF